jgi:hypothetical protein
MWSVVFGHGGAISGLVRDGFGLACKAACFINTCTQSKFRRVGGFSCRFFEIARLRLQPTPAKNASAAWPRMRDHAEARRRGGRGLQTKRLRCRRALSAPRDDRTAKMRYRLRTLHIALGVGPPLLAAMWFVRHWLLTAIGWALIVGFFALWYWTLRRAQALHPRTRGYPRDD